MIIQIRIHQTERHPRNLHHHLSQQDAKAIEFGARAFLANEISGKNPYQGICLCCENGKEWLDESA